jgi:hypothetical protein
MATSKLTKVFVLASGMAFLTTSVLGLSGLIGSSLNQPTTKENTAQSQNAQLQAQEKGFLAVLKREPNNPTALQGTIEIWRMRIQQGDAQGVKKTIEGLVKSNPKSKQYKELLAAIDKTIADTKKVGTLKPTVPQQPTSSSK